MFEKVSIKNGNKPDHFINSRCIRMQQAKVSIIFVMKVDILRMSGIMLQYQRRLP
jgi:hypothetical protein